MANTSNMQKKNILVFRPLPEDQLARLQAAHNVTVADPRKEPEAFAAALRTAHGLIGSSHTVDAALLDAAPQLEVISSVSVGVDNYPLAELHRRGIVLCHTPDVLTETVADTVFAILMATQRRVVEGHRRGPDLDRPVAGRHCDAGRQGAGPQARDEGGRAAGGGHGRSGEGRGRGARLR
ncbi:bifunctional glyoxylate/hydroxypyruvate reductase B, partial [Variovorax sp. CAN2819]|nr:bifunctional glyoxylate/hydroxypyruvate reductase B [Variovorax sp. CAN15]